VEDLVHWDKAFSLEILPRGKYLDELLKDGTLLGNRYCLDADAAIKLANPLAAEDAPPGQYRGLARRQFTGGAWGMTCSLTRFPHQQLTIICLTNNDEIAAWAMNRRIADLLLVDQLQPQVMRPTMQSATELPTVKLSEKDLSRLSGDYRPKGSRGAPWTIQLTSRGLELIDHLQKAVPLRPLSANSLDPDGSYFYATTRFVFSESERPSFTAQWDEPENRGQIEFERVELTTPTAADLASYVGQYECDELAITYRTEVREGAMWLRIGSRRWEQLDATVLDEFIPHVREPADMRVFIFVRGPGSKVTGLEVDYYRVKGVKFEKR
jgi:hypothetical protein